MSSEVSQNNAPRNRFEDLTLSDLLITLINAGYSFEQLRRMTMAQIYGVIQEADDKASSTSQAQAA
ncbi:MAG TPA: hypothetical protein VM943_11690 [Pyrinomonadaceae bacterium]|nr:hypothetical protein [Pyrinomonadaceae bacterium]